MEATRTTTSTPATSATTTPASPGASATSSGQATAAGPASNARPTSTTDGFTARREAPKAEAARTDIPDYKAQAKRRSFFVKIAGFTPIVAGIVAPIVLGASAPVTLAVVAGGLIVGGIAAAATHLGMGGGISAVG